MRIACLHTTSANQALFSDLFSRQVPRASIIHQVRDDLLTQAQAVGKEAVIDAVLEALGALTGADAILCTCSTLGPVIDLVQSPKFIRIDRPMMEEAAAIGPRPLLVSCLDSADAAAAELLAELRGSDLDATRMVCHAAWPYYERRNETGFCNAIADHVRPLVAGHDCVVLTQASMAVAAPMLADIGVPVLTSPALAVARTVAACAVAASPA